MNFYVMTLFPEMIKQGLNTSIIGRAIEKNLLSKEFWEKHFDSKFKLKNRFYSNGSNKNTSGTGRR